MPARPARQLLATYAVAFVSHLGWSVLSPVLPLIRTDFGVSLATVSLLLTVYGLARMAISLPAGYLGDRLGHRRLLLAGCLTLAVGSALGATATSFTTLLVSRMISGVGACLMVVTNQVAVAQLSSAENRGRNLGIYQAAAQAGTTVSPAISGLLAAWGGWNWSLWFAMVSALGTWVLILAMPGMGRDTIKGTVGKPVLEGGAGGTPHLPSLFSAHLITFVLMFAGTTFVTTFLPLYGNAVIGLDAVTLGWIMAMGTMIRFMVSIGGGELSDRKGRRYVLLPGLVMTAAGFVVVMYAQSLWPLVLGMAITSLGRFGAGVPGTVLTDHLPRARWGAATGLNRLMGDLGLVVGPAVVGLLMDNVGMRAAGATLAIAMLVAAVSVLGVREPVRRSAAA